MKFGTQKALPLIPAGEHVLTLREVGTKEFPSFNNPNEQVERTMWRFTSNEEDEDGAPYEFRQYTGMVYGNNKAALTKLIDMLVPGMTEDDFEEFDSDDLIGKKFKAQIKHAKNDKGDVKPELVFITPLKKPEAKKKAAEEEEDVFADD